jgi:LysR family transcriptional regulator, glycine cleavage system transcriptional activator
MRRLPPLSALPAFEATARLGSVTAAADELGRTHGAISKQIAHLSDDVGGALFEKSGNGLKLTARGDRLRMLTTGILDDLDRMAQLLRDENDDRHLDLFISATLATRWLIPRLPRFYARHPEIEIHLRMSGPDWVPDHEIDVVMSYDRLRKPGPEPDAIALGDTAYGPVCAPGYELVKQGDTWHAQTSLTHAGARNSWAEWGRLAGTSLVADHDLVHPHHLLALEAAAAGLGVALAELHLVETDLASGRLVAPLGLVTVPEGFQATVKPHATGKKSVRKLIDWLKEEAG